MADIIQIRAGNLGTMPTLRERELAYVKDKKALYIGTTDGNVKLCDVELQTTVTDQGKTITALQGNYTSLLNSMNSLSGTVASQGKEIGNLQTSQNNLSNTVENQGNAIGLLNTEVGKKLTASPAAAQAELAAEADLAAIITAHNSLIAALKAGGVMST